VLVSEATRVVEHEDPAAAGWCVRSQNASRNDVHFGQDVIAALKSRVIPVAMTKDASVLGHLILVLDKRPH